MENPGDKFTSLLAPNCKPSDSQQDELQISHLVRQSEASSDDNLIQSSSSPDTSPENPTGIEMVSLPDSFDEYQTPPEHHSSQNSSNDGHVVATKTTGFDEQSVVDLGNESDNLDTEPMDVDVDEADGGRLVDEGLDTEVISSPEDGAHQVFEETRQREQDEKETEVISSAEKTAHQVFVEKRQSDQDGKPVTEGGETVVTGSAKRSAQEVFVEMPQREQESSKRKLPDSMKTEKQQDGDLSFMDVLHRALKLLESSRGGGVEDEDDGLDLIETAKMRGWVLPRPPWWPKEGCEE